MTGGLSILVNLEPNKKKTQKFAIGKGVNDVLLVFVVDRDSVGKLPKELNERMKIKKLDNGDFIYYDEDAILFQDFRKSIHLVKDYELFTLIRDFTYKPNIFKFSLSLFLDTEERRNGVKIPYKFDNEWNNIDWIESDIKDIFNNAYYGLQLLDITNIKSLRSSIYSCDWFDLDEQEIKYLKEINYLKIPMNINPLCGSIRFSGEYINGKKIDILSTHYDCFDVDKYNENHKKRNYAIQNIIKKT